MHLEAVLLCEALPDPTVSIGGFIPCIKRLCTLVLSLCDFTFYSCKGDDDIKIQRRHIKLGNNELKRRFATTDR